MMSRPELSVIIPVYNGERYLADALDSVRQQHGLSLEVIVVDDGSTDATARIAQERRDVRYVRQENRGPSAARNRGIAVAEGDLIAFLDADDLWAADTLHRHSSALRDDPALDLVSGHVQCLTLRGTAHWDALEAPRALPSFGATMVRRAAIERVGTLDESLRCGEDVDWFMRAREAGVNARVLPEVVLFYRLHGGNLTKGWSPQDAGYVRAVKKMLDQRRSARTS